MHISHEKLTSFRRDLHQYPELSGQEKETAEKLYQYVLNYNPSSVLEHIGGHGIMATWDSAAEGPHIMIRADFDALPIAETNDFAHRSLHEHVSHKCGHDGHATILCGVAEQLHATPIKKGKVTLLFQPAEETGQGAKTMIADKNFPAHQYDYVFALHNLPGFPMHEVDVKNGSFTPSVTSIIIGLTGKTAHAAEPEHGINPCEALATILQEVLLLQHNDSASDDMAVVAPVCMQAGEHAYGVTAAEGSIHFTIRCWTQKKLEALQEKIEKIARDTAATHSLQCEINYTESFVANDNNEAATNLVRKSCKEQNLSLKEITAGLKWGEDFGLFSQTFPGTMFGLGSGVHSPALHNPDYDFPDEIIPTGVKVFTGIIKELLH